MPACLTVSGGPPSSAVPVAVHGHFARAPMENLLYLMHDTHFAIGSGCVVQNYVQDRVRHRGR